MSLTRGYLGTYVPLALGVRRDYSFHNEPNLGSAIRASCFRIPLMNKELAWFGEEEPMAQRLKQLWNDEGGQDIAEYAVMLAVILVIVVGTIRLIGSNANNVFSQVGSSLQ
jgi:Flp pilus assembly pilin Flp